VDTGPFVRPFQERRRRLLLAVLIAVVAPILVGVMSYGAGGTAAALVLAPLCLATGLWLSAQWARQNYRCPRCAKIPMRVAVRRWTKYTRYLRWLQVSKRFTIYPQWAVLFLDFNPRRCPSCRVPLARDEAELVSAT
jgi:hypothetical protein